MTYTRMANKITKGQKFKALEKNAKDSPVKDLEWQGEEVGVESDTKLEQDTGTGIPIVLRFFDFGANPKVFKDHKPTAQELFNGHIKGMEALLWKDGLTRYEGVEPRLMFSKDKKRYRFVIACVPNQTLHDTPQTLSQLMK